MAETLLAETPRVTFRLDEAGQYSPVSAQLYAAPQPEIYQTQYIKEDLGTFAAQTSLVNVEAKPLPAATAPERTRADTWGSHVFDRLTASRFGKVAVPAVVALAGIGVGASSGEKAKASTQTAPAEIVQEKTTVTLKVGKSSISDSAFAKATVLGNYRTISKAKMRKAEREGNCVTLDGSETNIWTQGRHEKGKPYGKDTRVSRFCKWGGKWYRKLCGNRAVFKQPKKAVKGPIIWVNNFSKANLRVSAKSEAEARAKCETANTSAYGYGRGSGYSAATVRLRNVIKGKGKLRELVAEHTFSASGEARSSASADASARCEESETTTTTTPAPQPTPTPQPTPEPTPEPTPTPTPEQNNPPEGRGDIPHRYVNTTDKVCVDPSDRDGDAVKAVSFSFRDTSTGQPAGEILPDGEPDEDDTFYIQPGQSDVQCVWYRTGSEPQSVTWHANLRDARGATGTSTPDEFPVLANDTGGN